MSFLKKTTGNSVLCTNWWVINIIWSTDGVDVWANRRGYYCLSF